MLLHPASPEKSFHFGDNPVLHLDVGEELALVSGHVRPVASREETVRIILGTERGRFTEAKLLADASGQLFLGRVIENQH